MQEIRHLVFNRDELQELALGFLGERGERPNLVGLVPELIVEEGGIRLDLTHAVIRSTERRTIALGSGELLAAAILHCKRRHVPLPMRGQKQLATMKGSLALVIAMRIGE